VHLKVADHNGTGDRYMSNAFQSTLKGNNLSKSSQPVYYGDLIKIKSEADQVFLHSHHHNYPLIYDYTTYKFSSGGQQVTGSHELNENNDWMILPAVVDPISEHSKEMVHNYDLIRLRHVPTGKYLATIEIASPLSSLTGTNLEVTTIEDETDYTSVRYVASVWIINIERLKKSLRGKLTLFQLINKVNNNRLGVNLKENLPEWGFHMREINSGKYDDITSWWLIDDISVPVPNKSWDDLEEYFTFSDKFYEMLEGKRLKNVSNANFSKDTTPSKWPRPTYRTSLWISKDQNKSIDLFGNPLAKLMSLIALPLLVVLAVVDFGAYLREMNFLTREQKRVLYSKGFFFLLCYLLHYLPFLFMSTTYSFQHYLPAYLFNALIFATFYQIMALHFKVLCKPALVAIICSAIAGSGIITAN
jgi:dolichyl-phosphate-mannose-protein mannosyltransferase